ncbi:MAG TPA: hypothetical protein VGY99_07150 [Candidatus Binataceae bacterium]|jgi:hypothetical protein|nr:hypothetical protein [Candidatus Binataceae bacterium]
MAQMEIAENRTIDQLHANYLAVRTAYREAGRKFNAMVASLKDIPAHKRTEIIDIRRELPRLLQFGHN